MLATRVVRYAAGLRRVNVPKCVVSGIRSKSNRSGYPPWQQDIVVPDHNKIIQHTESHEETLPELPSRAPSLIEIRKLRQQNQVDFVPPKYQESTSEKTRTWIYNIAAVVICSLILAVFKLTTDDEAAAKQQMQILAADLRKKRAAAKRALQRTATETGEIPTRGTKMIRYYASGPGDAPVYVLLHAEDGETAALWGHVHEILAKQSQVRVVSFYQTGVHNDRSRSVPLSLRMNEIDILTDYLTQQRRSHAAARGGSSFSLWGSSGSSPQKSPEYVVVSHGEGAWANLTYAAFHPEAVRASVCVTPLLMHRGRRMAWVDAVAAASRVTLQTDPKVLDRHLDPPPLQADAKLLAVDALKMQGAGSNVLKMMNTIGSAGGPITDAEKRLAEDMRKKRATEPILSDFDMELLLRAAPELYPTAGTRRPAVCVLSPDVEALPLFIRKDQLLSAGAWFTQACNALGMAMLPAERRIGLVHARDAVAADVAVELSNGAFKPTPPAQAVEAAESLTMSQKSTSLANCPLVFRLEPDSASALSVGADPEAFELQRVQNALNRFSRLFTFEKPIPPSKSFTQLFLRKEWSLFPGNFRVELIKDSEEDAPTSLTPWSPFGWLADEPSSANLAILPLQVPHAIARNIASYLPSSAP